MIQVISERRERDMAASYLSCNLQLKAALPLLRHSVGAKSVAIFLNIGRDEASKKSLNKLGPKEET